MFDSLRITLDSNNTIQLHSMRILHIANPPIKILQKYIHCPSYS